MSLKLQTLPRQLTTVEPPESQRSTLLSVGLVPVSTPAPDLSVGEKEEIRLTTLEASQETLKPIAQETLPMSPLILPGFPVWELAVSIQQTRLSSSFATEPVLCQVCSAVMNRDYTVVQDYIRV